MTISHLSFTTPSVAAASSLTLAKPSGVAEGDLMIIYIHIGDFPAPRYPVGWVEVPWRPDDIPSDGFTLISKIAGDAEPSDYTLTWQAATVAAAGIVAYRSDAASHMRFPTAGWDYELHSNDATPTTRFWPQVTISQTAFMALFGSYGFSSTPQGGITERWDQSLSPAPRAYLMETTAAAGLTPAYSADSTFISNWQNLTLPIIEDDPDPYPGPIFISAAWNNGTVDGSQTVTLPTDILPGDMIILQTTATSATPTGITGFDLLTDILEAGNEGLYVYMRIAEEGDAGATVTVNLTAGSTRCAVGVMTFRSLRGRNLLIEMMAKQTNGASTEVQFPDAITAYDHAAVAHLVSFPVNVNFGDAEFGVCRYTQGESTVSYQIRGYSRYLFGPGSTAYSPSVSSSTTEITATIVIVEEAVQRREYKIGIGHDLDEGDLDPITPQPSSPGVMYTRRLPSGNHGVYDEGPFVPLEWNVLYNGAAYQALLSQFGLDVNEKQAVTVLARDEVWNWARFNGYAIQPLPGEDITYERFFPQSLTILVTDLELIEVID